jgi:hypothetical protein
MAGKQTDNVTLTRAQVDQCVALVCQIEALAGALKSALVRVPELKSVKGGGGAQCAREYAERVGGAQCANEYAYNVGGTTCVELAEAQSSAHKTTHGKPPKTDKRK